jgi:DNA-binding CsgD family transcriptional regulator
MDKGSKGKTLITVLGLACYWPLFRNHYFGLIFSRQTTTTVGDEGAWCYLAFLLLLIAFGLAAAFRGMLATELISRRWPVLLIALLSSGLTLVLLLPLGEPVTRLALILGAGVFALYVFFMTMAWGLLMLSRQHGRTMLYLALSFFISYLISTSTQLPHPFDYVLPLFGPLLSGVAWYVQRLDLSGSQTLSRGLIKQPITKTILVLILFLLTGSIVRGFFDLGVLHYAPVHETNARSLFSIALSFVLVLVASFSRHHERLINPLWVVFVLLFFGGLFVTAAFSAAWWQTGTDIIIMSRTFLVFFLWIVLLNTALRYHQSLLFLFGAFFLTTDGLSGLLTNYLVPLLPFYGAPLAREFTVVFALIMAFILLLGSFAYLSSLAFRRQAESGNADDSSREAVCAELAREHGLTHREQELLFYLSQGHSLKKIADTLFISVSTAQSHVKSLYRKLGIHNRQEAIDGVSGRLFPG